MQPVTPGLGILHRHVMEKAHGCTIMSEREVKKLSTEYSNYKSLGQCFKCFILKPKQSRCRSILFAYVK